MSKKSGKPAGKKRAPALLDFEPVTRKVKRPDAWTPELQRQFIALLAETGSPQQAAVIMGKKLSGMRALYDQEGSDSFRAAWDHALAIGEKNMVDEALLGVRSRLRAFREGPDEAADEADDEGADDHDERLELIERLIAKFQRKVGHEREARLAGEVAAADFYLRQITVLEVAFDLLAEGLGTSGWTMLIEARRGGLGLLEIADTEMARVLDQARREQWAAMAESGRPMLWPDRYCLGTAGGDVRTEPLEYLGRASRAPAGVDPDEWSRMDCDEQKRIYDEQHRRDAEAQVGWERRNAEETAEWREAQERKETKE